MGSTCFGIVSLYVLSLQFVVVRFFFPANVCSMLSSNGSSTQGCPCSLPCLLASARRTDLVSSQRAQTTTSKEEVVHNSLVNTGKAELSITTIDCHRVSGPFESLLEGLKEPSFARGSFFYTPPLASLGTLDVL